MNNRKLNVSASAGGRVSVRRNRFDSHIDGCAGCQAHGLCPMAQTLWRAVVVEAIRAAK